MKQVSKRLGARIARLEAAAAAAPEIRVVSEFRFGLWVDRLAPDTEIPAGGRVVQDMYVIDSCEGWNPGGMSSGGVRYAPEGATYKNGYFRERITTDPEDHGRDIPAEEDPAPNR